MRYRCTAATFSGRGSDAIAQTGVIMRADGRCVVGRAAEGCEVRGARCESRPTRNCLRSTGGCEERHGDDGVQNQDCAGLRSALRMATCAVVAIRRRPTGVGSDRGCASSARELRVDREAQPEQHHAQHSHGQKREESKFTLRVAIYVPLDVGKEDQGCSKSRINLGCQGRRTLREHRGPDGCRSEELEYESWGSRRYGSRNGVWLRDEGEPGTWF